MSLHPPLCGGGSHATVIVSSVTLASDGAHMGASGGPSAVRTASDGVDHSETADPTAVFWFSDSACLDATTFVARTLKRWWRAGASPLTTTSHVSTRDATVVNVPGRPSALICTS